MRSAARLLIDAARSPSGAAIVLAATLAVIALAVPSVTRPLGIAAVVVALVAVLYRFQRQQQRSVAHIAHESKLRTTEQQALGRRLDDGNENARDLRARVDEQRSEQRLADRRAEQVERRLQRSVERLDERARKRASDIGAVRRELKQTAERIDLRIDRLGRRVSKERSHRILSVAKLTADGRRPQRLVVIVAMQRAASTLLLDRLCDRPGVGLWPTARWWAALGVEGRRYPADVSDGPRSQLGIEVRRGVGETIPTRRAHAAATEPIAVEKVHPEFFGFASAEWAATVEQVRRQLDVQIVYLVRDPLAAMWSMHEYQQRNRRWYPWLDTAEIPGFVRRSIAAIAEVRPILGGQLLTYDDVVEQSEHYRTTIDALVSGVEVTLPQDAEMIAALDEADDDDAGPFRGDRLVRVPSGPNDTWTGLADAVEDATTVYDELRRQNNES